MKPSPTEKSERLVPSSLDSTDWLFLVVPMVFACWGFWQFRGFVQDDAFISLRYSYNFAHGKGLVFNPGEYVEGFTNMLWTLLGSLSLWLGLPAIGIWQALGLLASLGTIALTFLTSLALTGPLGACGAAAILSCSTTLHAWSGSGLETALFTFLVTAAIYAQQQQKTKAAFGLLGIAQWTRPEAAMAAIALLYVHCLTDYREGTFTQASFFKLLRKSLYFFVPLVALLCLRWGYYGSIVPNTFLVKGSGIPANHLLGLKKIITLLPFDATGLVWLFVAIALCPPSKRSAWKGWCLVAGGFLLFGGIDVYLNDGGFWKAGWGLGNLWSAISDPKWDHFHTLVSAMLGGLGLYTLTLPKHLRLSTATAWMACLWFGYLYYYVRVGGDLLPMHRLLMPALPLQAVLASLGAFRLRSQEGPLGFVLGDSPDELTKAEVRGAAFAIGATACLFVMGTSLEETMGKGHFRTVLGALKASHGRAGQDLQSIAVAHNFRPKALAQDMGALPMNAPQVDFIDTIGLTDRPIAKILWEYRYSPYFRYLVWDDATFRERFLEMEEKLRKHISEERKPEYAVINVHLKPEQTQAARLAAKNLDSEFFEPLMKSNSFFYKWTESKYFQENFVLMKAYEYSTVHFLVTYRRKDQPSL